MSSGSCAMRGFLLFVGVAVLCACNATSEPASNRQTSGAATERNEAGNAVVRCDDCGPPVYDANGQIIPQG